MTCPLTPAEALAFAAVITCDKRFPHLHAAADRLRQWGQPADANPKRARGTR